MTYWLIKSTPKYKAGYPDPVSPQASALKFIAPLNVDIKRQLVYHHRYF